MAAIEFIFEPEKTEEELTKERRDSYVASLLRERDGYKQRLLSTTDVGVRTNLERQVQGIADELAAIGADAEPRGKGLRK